LVAWVESDLRRQLQRELPAGGLVSVTGVLLTTLRRAVPKSSFLTAGLKEAKNYIRGIATNARREKTRNAYAQKRQPENGAVVSLEVGFDPEDISEQQAQEIWEAVDRLPIEFSSVLRAVFIEGRTQMEYAKQAGLSPKQVERLLNRALEQLKPQLGIVPE
jgi:RNA polymerase sigma factor (sigma-70 family)